MSIEDRPGRGLLAKLLLVALLPFLGGGACTLDEITFPPLVGPSEQALSLEIRAVPNIVNADGVSTSTITVQARNQDGAPAANRQLFFQLTNGDGLIFSGTVFVGPLQGGLSLGTAGNGTAQITYLAGTTPGIRVWVAVQAYSFDAAGDGEPYHWIAIDQR